MQHGKTAFHEFHVHGLIFRLLAFQFPNVRELETIKNAFDECRLDL